jgi:Mn2+/Fe2+ NRAMP family transporter
MMMAVQFICSKIGLVTGMGVAGVLRKHYSRKILYPAVLGLIVANTINAGADLGSIAAAVQLLAPIPTLPLMVGITVLMLTVQVWGSYRLIRWLMMLLTLSLLGYVVSAFLSRPDWTAVLWATLVPQFRWDAQFLSVVVAILGTTISPYLFFWQASQEVEDEFSRGHSRLWQRQGTTNRELRYAAWDTAIGMVISNAIMFFIILATGATLFTTGHRDVQSAAQAAEALRPLAGAGAEILLALALIGSGLLSVPVLTGSAAYAVCETVGWKYGFTRTPSQSKEFYGVIAASTLVGMSMNFLGLNPFAFLLWAAVINGLLAPPLLAAIMLISNNLEVMKDRVNGPVVNALGWLATAVTFAAVLALAWTWIA